MHEHSHEHHRPDKHNRTALTLALLITLLIMAAEFIGGWLSGSLALISDAGHMLTDAGALGLALFALWFSRRPATPEKTYGFYRMEILAALLNGSLLIVLAGYIFYEAFRRLVAPTPVAGELMLAVAVVGLAANLLSALILSRGSRDNLNIRAALWHVLSDAFSSLGVIAGALLVIFFNWTIADPIIGLLIGLVILRGAWLVVREAVDILLESTPSGVEYHRVQGELERVQEVKGVHDLHIWTITSGRHALSAHILVDDNKLSVCGEVSRECKKLLREKFGIDHATLEFECENCADALICPVYKEG